MLVLAARTSTSRYRRNRGPEIRITRTFNAPARIVFDALYRPENVRRWWAPKSRGEMTLCEIDLRVGGAWRFQMRTVAGDIVGSSLFRRS